ncbi:hypothetical protein [Arcobacter sp.]|uniref:hypothetical protein n=1 Tax=unclassified Arcobacter TaxID=2593671 RepID=UPI003AFFCFC6
MDEMMDLIYDKTGVELAYWILLLAGLLIAAIVLNLLKNRKISHNDKSLYEKSRNYLEKVEEYKRKPMPLFILIVLIFAVVIEAMGFAYIFSDYILSDASNSDLRVAGVLGAVLIASILVPLTHVTGEQIYYNKKIDTLESYFDGKKDVEFDSIPHLRIENTNKDDDLNSRATSIYSRTEPEIKKGKFVRKRYLPMFTSLLILVIAVGAYKVREETYLTKEKRESQAFEEQAKASFNKDTKSLPSFLIDTSKDNADVQNRGIIESKRRSNLITYVILMFMFLGIQVIGIFSGMNWGFIGKESKLAYLNCKNYKKGSDNDKK